MRDTPHGVATTDELARRVLRQHALAFAEHAPQATADSDPEHVHQTRVAIRRMRAALRVFESVLSTETRDLKPELEWVASQLGPIRDLDVQIERLRRNAQALDLSAPLVPYGAWLEEQRQRALAAWDDAFRSQRFLVLAQRLSDLDVAADTDPSAPPVEQEAPRLLRSAFKKLRRRADGLGANAPDVQFHQARIRAKRLRYAMEFFGSLYGKPGRKLIDRATRLQDVLGEHQDGVVSTHRIHEAVHTAAGVWPAETSVALGRVVQWEAALAQRARGRVRPTYREVEEAWKRVRRVL